jgi:MoxR-like ATPase
MLDTPFIVLATQNPIEQSGTYRLPEAQLDRFMLKINVDYPTKKQEIEMYKRLNDNFDEVVINEVLNKRDIKEIQKILDEIHVSDNIYEYVSNIIDSTRNPHNYSLKNAQKYLKYGISPR